MIFNSVQYAFFLALVVPLYYLVPNRLRLPLLLLASYAFYAAWSVPYVALIVILTLLNYGFGHVLHALAGRRSARYALAVFAGIDLGVLGFFKYELFLLHNLQAVLGWANIHDGLSLASPVLPLGISFFTFEFIHYLVDISRGHEPVRGLLRFAIFAAFFPTQVAGPIKRYEDFVPQLDHRPLPDWERFGAGAKLIAGGLFKKIAIADNLGALVGVGFGAGGGHIGMRDAWLAGIAFTAQIYCDFSGYSDIGRGSAMLLGFDVPNNFLRPYLAQNISDFWRRWHVSLSMWMRDYLYIPLGGNVRARYRNLFLTMVLAGVWHGALWTFALWGAFHGAMLCVYWWIRSHINKRRPTPASIRFVLSLGSWALTMSAVTVGFVIFHAANIGQAISMLTSMLRLSSTGSSLFSDQEAILILGVVAAGLAYEAVWEWGPRIRTRLGTPGPGPANAGALIRSLQPAAYVALFSLAVVLQPNVGPQFIYFQF